MAWKELFKVIFLLAAPRGSESRRTSWCHWREYWEASVGILFSVRFLRFFILHDCVWSNRAKFPSAIGMRPGKSSKGDLKWCDRWGRIIVQERRGESWSCEGELPFGQLGVRYWGRALNMARLIILLWTSRELKARSSSWTLNIHSPMFYDLLVLVSLLNIQI